MQVYESVVALYIAEAPERRLPPKKLSPAWKPYISPHDRDDLQSGQSPSAGRSGSERFASDRIRDLREGDSIGLPPHRTRKLRPEEINPNQRRESSTGKKRNRTEKELLLTRARLRPHEREKPLCEARGFFPCQAAIPMQQDAGPLLNICGRGPPRSRRHHPRENHIIRP